MYKETKYLNAGDKALVIEFSDKISDEVNSKVRSMMIAINQRKLECIVEMIPTYRSLMINYNPLKIEYDELINSLKDIEQNLGNIEIPPPKIIKIPTLYGGEYGPDIENVSKHNNLSIDEVIKIHSSKEYLIYMLGFTPGFPYLGGMDERLETPRLQVPRTKIPAGSVGIASKQTGIYPIDSPGGWQLIGRTPLKLFDINKENPFLLSAGSYIKFTPITKEEFDRIDTGGEL